MIYTLLCPLTVHLVNRMKWAYYCGLLSTVTMVTLVTKVTMHLLRS